MRRALRPETTAGSGAIRHDSSAQPATNDPQGGHRPHRSRGRIKGLGWLIAAVSCRRYRHCHLERDHLPLETGSCQPG